jgi:uncharacterized surface protein with fasciclin (FAS1) repeats
MKYTRVLSFAVAASAAVASSDVSRDQKILDEGSHHESSWDSLPSRNNFVSSIEDMIGCLGHTIDQAMDVIARTGRRVVSSVLDDDDESYGRRNRQNRGDRDSQGSYNRTLYDLIRESQNTRQFSKLIDRHKDIRERLQNDKREYTVFVPTDEALRQLPRRDESSREYIEKILEYHIVPSVQTEARLMNVHTIPTILEERDLGYRSQRLRISVGIFGIRVNFYSHIIATNFVSCFCIL